MSIMKSALRFFTRRGALILLSAALFSLAVSGSQCARTTDRVFSPRFSPTGDPDTFGQCVSECAHANAEARQAESELFRREMALCDEDKECKKRRAADHVERLVGITHDFKVCMAGCHGQGGGMGGN